MPSLIVVGEERRGVFNVGMGPNYSIPFPVVRFRKEGEQGQTFLEEMALGNEGGWRVMPSSGMERLLPSLH